MECLNNTEIAIHDNGNRVVSALQYLGGTTSTIVIGRDMGWGTIGTIVLNGNVGIGTATANTKLDVNGAISSSGAINANGNSLIFPNTLSDYKITLWSGFGFGVQSGELKYTSGGAHKFYTGSTNTLTIDSSGNVGIGITPSYCLHLPSNKELRVEGGSSRAISIGGSGSFSIDAPSIPSGRFIVNNAGNVGIGTATPNTKLDVRGAITLGNDLWHNSTDGINRIWYATNGCTYFHSGNNGSEGFAFRNKRK